MTDLWNEINQWLPALDETSGMIVRLERNYVLCGFSDLWQRYDWKAALEQFRSDLRMFNVDETTR